MSRRDDLAHVTAPAELVYLTAAEVAELLHVSEKSIYRWAKADPSMPVLKIGGTTRFPRARLERWLRDREQGRPTRARRRSPKQALSPAQVSDSTNGAPPPTGDCAILCAEDADGAVGVALIGGETDEHEE